MRALKYILIREWFALCDWTAERLDAAYDRLMHYAEECRWPYLWITLVTGCLFAGFVFALRSAYYEIIY